MQLWAGASTVLGRWQVRKEEINYPFKMRVLKIQLVVLIVGVIEQVIAVTNPSEDVLRDLHSKFAKYNKDLR